jgi:tetratricopeptide (TPR) repeat protein
MKRLKKLLRQKGKKLPDLKSVIKKAGLLACFFLFQIISFAAPTNSWRFDAESDALYRMVINLRTEEAIAKLQRINHKENLYYRYYIQSLAECIEILITEDESKFPRVEANFKQRLNYLEAEKESAETLFLRAELSLQRGFCYLNMNQSFNAILSIRQAYNLTESCLKKYPDFLPVRKTSGVLQVMLGTIPDKYHWFLSLLGMEGSVKKGQSQLNELRQANVSLNVEANVLYYTIKGLINQQFNEAALGLTEILKKEPDNRLLMFIAINMYIKNEQSEDALQLIKRLDQKTDGLPLVYLEYLRAEILLQKGDYNAAISAYQLFMKTYKGSSFRKDATLKIGIAYQMLNKPQLAKVWWEKAKSTGKEVAEPDVLAASMISEGSFPNEKLFKIKLLTEGGYFKEARSMISNLTTSSFSNLKDQTEFLYRKARFLQVTNDLRSASGLYLKVIEMTSNNPWYFGAASCLQLGNIYKNGNEFGLARKYFERVLSYRKHAYKNNFDIKAKAALAELEKIKN